MSLYTKSSSVTMDEWYESYDCPLSDANTIFGKAATYFCPSKEDLEGPLWCGMDGFRLFTPEETVWLDDKLREVRGSLPSISCSESVVMEDLLYVLQSCEKPDGFRRSDIFSFVLPPAMEKLFNGFDTDEEAAVFMEGIMEDSPYRNLVSPLDPTVIDDVYLPVPTKIPGLTFPRDVVAGDLVIDRSGNVSFVWHKVVLIDDSYRIEPVPLKLSFDKLKEECPDDACFGKPNPVFALVRHGFEIDPNTFELGADDLYWLSDALTLRNRLGLMGWPSLDEALDDPSYTIPMDDDSYVDEVWPEVKLFPEVYDILSISTVPFLRNSFVEHSEFVRSVHLGRTVGMIRFPWPELMTGFVYSPSLCWAELDDASATALYGDQENGSGSSYDW